MNIIKNMVRIGVVSSIDFGKGTVRVTFPDREDHVSDELPVLAPHYSGWAAGNDLPGVGKSVLCLFLGTDLKSGFCLGPYYTAGNYPLGTAEQRGVWFEDGSYVYYDRLDQALHIKAGSSVRIEGDLIVSGSITRAGALV